jgi:hypothetical protein
VTIDSLKFARLRERYAALQQQFREGSEAARTEFKKYFDRTRKFTTYYARGGLGWMRERDIARVDFSTLRRTVKHYPIRTFEELSQKAHDLNWVVFQGKHFVL